MASIENGTDSPAVNETKTAAEVVEPTAPVTPSRPAADFIATPSSNTNTPASFWPGKSTVPISFPTSPNSLSGHMTAGGGSQPSSPMRSSTGLSELSKQLRVLQAQNDAKSSEIDRLTRQIQILADLQGVSVANLRKALDDACEAAALAELQSRVAGLKAQLEAATAVSNAGKTVQEDVMAKKVANLELKVGELEELEERQRGEKRELFSRLREKTDELARLEAQVLHLTAENERLSNEQSPATVVEADAVVPVPMEEEAAKGIAPPEHVTADRDGAAMTDYQAEITALETRLQQAESELQTTREKLALSDEQKHSEGEQEKLRTAQFKARFIVQEDNIRDMEQQLSSLYTAFQLVRDQQEQDRYVLQASLGQADEAVARLQDNEVTVSGRATKLSQGTATTTTTTLHHHKKPAEMIPIVSLQLWVRGNGNFRKWKKHPAVLYTTMSHHILDLGTGKTYNIYFELAKLATHRLQVFGFTIYLNPKDPHAPELWLAAANREEYITWMEALKQATTESSSKNDADESSSSQLEEQELERALKRSEEEK